MTISQRTVRERRRLERTAGPGERASVEPPRQPLREVAVAIGNQAFTHFVQRSEAILLRNNGGATATAPGVPVVPRREATDFGEFLIYPNAAKLGPASYHQMPPGVAGPVDAFRVTEATFARVRSAMKAVNAGKGWLTIEGTAEFKAKVMLDLAWILTSSVGQELFDAMAKSGHKMTIEETSGRNSISYDIGTSLEPGADASEKDDGTPGKGCDVTVKHNPGQWNPYGGTEAWMTAPPGIGLAHEMVHGWTGMTGIRARGTAVVGGVTERRAELQATGLGEWEKARFSENRFRAAFGLPLQSRYTP